MSLVDGRDFRNGVARLVRERGHGPLAKIRAPSRLINELYSYSAYYICPFRNSPLLSAAQEHLSEMRDSFSYSKLNVHASAARDLYMKYLYQTSTDSSMDIEVLMLWVATNGFFIATPGQKAEAQQALSSTLEIVWSCLDGGYQLGSGSNDDYTRNEATALMQAILADAQIACGLSFC